jgi:hypothetical protein
VTAAPQSTVLLEGPAYGRVFRYGATFIALGLGWGLFMLYRRGEFAAGVSTGLGWFLAGFALVCLFTATIVVSRTRVERVVCGQMSTDVLVQTWLGDKRAMVDEIAFARFIYYPAFTWLVAPRLYLVLVSGKITAIYVASQALYEYAADIERKVRDAR